MSNQIKNTSPEVFIIDNNQPIFHSFRDALASSGTAILKHDKVTDTALDFARSTASGLSIIPRQLECRYLYDKQGSMLFEQITQQPEYYLTRTEADILASNADRIRSITGPVTLVELGSGSSVKTGHLLRAWLACESFVRYIPVDVSENALSEACSSIANIHYGVQVIGVNSDYRDAFPIIRDASPVMTVFLGSTIGNFSSGERSLFLTDLACSLSPGDFFLLGVDLVKDDSIIEPAYNDSAGVTADFTRNLFARMNRELSSDIDLSAIEHIARYNPTNEQVEIYAHFAQKQIIHVAPLNRTFTIACGEMIHTEISRKFRLETFVPYLKGFGFELQEVFTDQQNWFALILLQRS